MPNLEESWREMQEVGFEFEMRSGENYDVGDEFAWAGLTLCVTSKNPDCHGVFVRYWPWPFMYGFRVSGNCGGMIGGEAVMPALVFYRAGQAVIVGFDPTKEVQADVERRHGVDHSDYYETREKAEQAVRSAPKADSYSGPSSLPSR